MIHQLHLPILTVVSPSFIMERWVRTDEPQPNPAREMTHIYADGLNHVLAVLPSFMMKHWMPAWEGRPNLTRLLCVGWINTKRGLEGLRREIFGVPYFEVLSKELSKPKNQCSILQLSDESPEELERRLDAMEAEYGSGPIRSPQRKTKSQKRQIGKKMTGKRLGYEAWCKMPWLTARFPEGMVSKRVLNNIGTVFIKPSFGFGIKGHPAEHFIYVRAPRSHEGLLQERASRVLQRTSIIRLRKVAEQFHTMHPSRLRNLPLHTNPPKCAGHKPAKN